MTWTAEDLRLVDEADELQIASIRPDGTLRPYVTIWMARTADGVFVRSAYGPDNPWFRRALASGSGRVRVGEREWDVDFEVPGGEVHEALDDAYHAKYDRYGPTYVRTVVGDVAAQGTLRLVNQADGGRPGGA